MRELLQPGEPIPYRHYFKAVKRALRRNPRALIFACSDSQDVIDKAVQLHGGDGVRAGTKVEELYREIRALRIYEGASEVQKIIIARAVLAASAPNSTRTDA